jgi:hypothetical protein
VSVLPVSKVGVAIGGTVAEQRATASRIDRRLVLVPIFILAAVVVVPPVGGAEVVAQHVPHHLATELRACSVEFRWCIPP